MCGRLCLRAMLQFQSGALPYSPENRSTWHGGPAKSLLMNSVVKRKIACLLHFPIFGRQYLRSLHTTVHTCEPRPRLDCLQSSLHISSLRLTLGIFSNAEGLKDGMCAGPANILHHHAPFRYT